MLKKRKPNDDFIAFGSLKILGKEQGISLWEETLSIHGQPTVVTATFGLPGSGNTIKTLRHVPRKC
ncbi:hypothetical protein Hypma_006287 [Hypsizygus marmoreus]|uniref:Uncharacterized protein n=1 Tax=Hypsizygus marmoreus TaxID=39966 RepID=A0A369K5Q2_HYPMA|nr:hypothetical protein Hypma_006287 [Hypsizygus marmoreus]